MSWRNGMIVLLDLSRPKWILSDRGFWAPSGHQGRCLVGISLIFLCRAWSKLDVQVLFVIGLATLLSPQRGRTVSFEGVDLLRYARNQAFLC
jgi:hypothetical protein